MNFDKSLEKVNLTPEQLKRVNEIYRRHHQFNEDFYKIGKNYDVLIMSLFNLSKSRVDMLLRDLRKGDDYYALIKYFPFMPDPTAERDEQNPLYVNLKDFQTIEQGLATLERVIEEMQSILASYFKPRKPE